MALRMRDRPGPDCLITGGEPVVKLVPSDRRVLGLTTYNVQGPMARTVADASLMLAAMARAHDAILVSGAPAPFRSIAGLRLADWSA